MCSERKEILWCVPGICYFRYTSWHGGEWGRGHPSLLYSWLLLWVPTLSPLPDPMTLPHFVRETICPLPCVPLFKRTPLTQDLEQYTLLPVLQANVRTSTHTWELTRSHACLYRRSSQMDPRKGKALFSGVSSGPMALGRAYPRTSHPDSSLVLMCESNSDRWEGLL